MRVTGAFKTSFPKPPSSHPVFIPFFIDAAITCPSGDSLFEVACSVDKGFTITVNEACRAAHFPMVDFANSFVWGDSTKMSMVDASVATAAGIDAAFTGADGCTDGTIDYNVKPGATGITDSAGTAAFGWEQIPLDSCGISSRVETDG